MMKVKKYILLLLLLMLQTGALVAGDAMDTDVFSCDFEDQADWANWQLNTTANTQQYNQLTSFWCLGGAGSFGPESHNGLYISTTPDGTESKHDPKSQLLTARHPLPHFEPGTYTYTMDWSFKGQGGREGIYLCMVPRSTVKFYSGSTSALPEYVKTHMMPVLPDSAGLGGVMNWEVVTFNFTVNEAASQEDWDLVIVVCLKGGVLTSPSPRVDNIRIFQADKCAAPKNIKHNSDESKLILDWEGESELYEVRQYNTNTDKWTLYDPVDTTSVQLPDVDEGVVCFYVRSNCGDYASAWVKYERFIFIKGRRCVEYLDLNEKNCFYGKFGNPSTPGCIDDGAASINSRHTLHYIEGEIDSRTMDGNGGGLHTKPDDALASVRLGNWNTGAESEGIMYTYKVVDESMAVMKLRYAIVLQEINHSDAEQAEFDLRVLHNGREIPNKCGYASFFTPNDGTKDFSGWHRGDGTWWRDWTTVSVNLRPYVGEVITIILTTRDCAVGGHYGYAYFTLDCEAGEMSGMNCGIDNPTTDFKAPDGFAYSWYKLSDPSKELSTEQTFTIDPMDTATYMVDLISKTNEKCYYTLRVCGMPRLPRLKVTAQDAKHPCANVVKFANDSRVWLQDIEHNTYKQSEERLKSVLWDFGDGTKRVYNSDDTVYHTYPDDGGQYTVKVYGSINGLEEDCVDSTTVFVYLGKKVPIPVEDHRIACKDKYQYGYPYEDKLYFYPNTLDSLFVLRSIYDCDSLVHMTLTWAESTSATLKDSICDGDVYILGTQKITTAGRYRETLVNSCGCDSLVELTIKMVDEIHLTMPDTVGVCAGDSMIEVPYQLSINNVNSIRLLFDSASQSHGVEAEYVSEENTGGFYLPAPQHPCQLHATLRVNTKLSCAVDPKDVVIDVRYSTSVLEQNSALIAVLDSAHNGGYNFVGVQWYRDGELVEGISQGVLRTTPEDIGHEFYAALTTPDGVTIPSCVLVYNGGIAEGIEHITLDQLTEPICVYDLFGRMVIRACSKKEITTLPHGFYLITDRSHAVKIAL